MKMTVILAAVAAVLSLNVAHAKDKTTRATSSSEAKYCGTWIVGPHGYHTEYDHFKPSTLLGTVKDGKYNVQIFAKTEGMSWDVLKDIDRNECICVTGERQGHVMKSTDKFYDCKTHKEIMPQYDNEESEGEDNT